MNTLKDLDKVYRDSFKTTFSKLEKSSADISSKYKFDLRKKEISEAVLERMKNYYSTQDAIKTFLDKRYIPAGADYFVETILFPATPT